MASLDSYLRLVTSEHADKPNFLAAITAIVQPVVDQQNVSATIPGKYDLDLAVGSQLDVVGQWVGLARRLIVPIPNVYFSLDTMNLGFNQGIWFQEDNPVEGLVDMDDGTYRLMLRAKILANIWDGSLGMANAGLANLFPGGSVQLVDNFNMTYSLQISGDAPSTLFLELVSGGYIPLRPAGVKLV